MRAFAVVWLLSSLVCGAVAGTAHAQTLGVDWKFYGAVKFDREGMCFYDAGGIVTQPDTHRRVWTKCLPQDAMDKVDITKDYDGKIVDSAARKIIDHYRPPLASIENLNQDQLLMFVQYEQTADISDIQPDARILYELDCSNTKMRELSLYVKKDGKEDTTEKPLEWKYVPPEGNASRLLKLLCPSS